MLDISLVIPVKNEGSSIESLIKSILSQEYLPNEIILVDGGSTDNTIPFLQALCLNDKRFLLIEAGNAMPGKGRNIGTGIASSRWIAYTDAGIKLDKYWLAQLAKKAQENPQADIIYGNYDPQINSFFDKCSAITYLPAAKMDSIRGKFIASCLLKKEVWKKVGGFPDWRATEDLVFMEKAEQLGYRADYAPLAKVSWQLRPDVISTFKRFDIYSKYNVWAGRQTYWHYPVMRQYILVLLIILLGIFHSSYWFWLLPLWIIARVVKRLYPHRYEFGMKELFNPFTYLGVMLVTFTMDAGTFSGWIKALFIRPPVGFLKETIQEVGSNNNFRNE